jgi:hypothetical protein
VGRTRSMHGRYEKCIQNKGRHHLGDLDKKGRTILKWVLKKHGVRMWNGFNWLRIGSSGRIL